MEYINFSIRRFLSLLPFFGYIPVFEITRPCAIENSLNANGPTFFQGQKVRLLFSETHEYVDLLKPYLSYVTHRPGS